MGSTAETIVVRLESLEPLSFSWLTVQPRCAHQAIASRHPTNQPGHVCHVRGNPRTIRNMPNQLKRLPRRESLAPTLSLARGGRR